MQLYLPILDQLKDAQNILIVGIGGGYDVFAGLPLYFTLKQTGKKVNLANFNGFDFQFATQHPNANSLLPQQVISLSGEGVLPYMPESALAEWFALHEEENVSAWIIQASGVVPTIESYRTLTDHLNIDAIILVDGGVDSLMHGDEEAPGTLLEDAISLAAIQSLDMPIKILACIGFGSELDVSHYHALENIATLTKQGAFLGSCALIEEQEVFQLYEKASRYAWNSPRQAPNHIGRQIIAAVKGEFDTADKSFISPLMSMYWFFKADIVANRSMIIPHLTLTRNFDEVHSIYLQQRKNFNIRRAHPIPY